MRIVDGIVKISVRDLVEFVLRQGSISASFVSNSRAVQGTLAHKKIQKSMDANYEAEIKLVHECEVDGIVFVVEGRADGIIQDLVSVTIDEIKSTTTNLDVIDENYNYLHWAQAKCYAYFYAYEHQQKEMRVRLTYYNLDTKDIKYLHRSFFYEELEGFFKSLIQKYCLWIKFYMQWVEKRDASLKSLVFPFESYRKGQRQLAVNVYKTIQRGEKIYISAPTGIGKTISTLFPALKAMGEGYGTKIFYLTAKTITRTVAEEAVERLAEQGAEIKTITLTAKDKICFLDKAQCHPDYCKWADGHYDRVDDAIYEMIQSCNHFTRPVIENYAKKYQVCPFELALDLAIWADVVICDYNYMFDPSVGLKRFLDNKDFVLLVDEAHNLVDRAREMYSATLSKKKCLQVKKSISKQYPAISKELIKINECLLDIKKEYIEPLGNYISEEAPKRLYTHVRRFIGACDKKLQKGALHNLPADLMELYFDAYNFGKIYELFDDHYRTYAESKGSEVELKLFCIDPSAAIGEIISTCLGVIFFSATLLPIDYYKYMLGGEEARAIAFESAFEKEQSLRLVAADVSTRFKDREESYDKISRYIEKMITKKVGHYMVFFPSYKYMIEVYEHFMTRMGEDRTYDVHIQESQMDEMQKEVFLARFVPQPERTTINFCVLGGIFSEGIDLTEDRLIGVIVVGVGLPQIGLERDLIKDYFNAHEREGYHYAYSYPGINKVFQAVGRLIRTEKDRGVILLIDDRFTTPFYRNLLVGDQSVDRSVNIESVEGEIVEYWERDRMNNSELYHK